MPMTLFDEHSPVVGSRVVYAVAMRSPHHGLRREGSSCVLHAISEELLPSIYGMNRPTSPTGGASRQIRSLTCGKRYQVVGAQGMSPSLPLGSKFSPVLSMVCIMTASLRATAMAARLKPRRSRSCDPQSLRRL